ncbi:hypothetical protein OG985_49670 (plasmid) [Streptomyces sp. NBC_00289]|uniref:hypothetical protein n=1 Tax=Streptomyces sp. NBC_00289 TaxID=2975703 RepID=UPI002F9068D5
MLPESEFAVILGMSPEQRAAFVAGVAERVFDLYMDCARPYRSNVWEAITAAWGRASGETIPGETAARLAEALDQEAASYCDDLDESIDIPFEVITAVGHALKAAFFGDPKDAEAAANFATGGIARAAHACNDDQDRAVQEELGWQLDWLRYVSTTEAEATRDGFSARTVTKPTWYLRWEN